MKKYDVEVIERVYYTIPQLAKELHVEASAVRYWIDEFQLDVPPGSHFKDNNRRIKGENLAIIREIHRLLKVEGYTTWGAKCKLRDFRPESL